MTDEERMIVAANLGEFFRDEISDACEMLEVNISDTVEFYLVNMLCENARAQSRLGEEPLALVYKRALEANRVERAKILKDLGDEALFVAGFFVEYIERSLVNVDYYISMGGAAYRSLADLVSARRRGDVFADVYRQMSDRFVVLVDLLGSIADKSKEQQGNPLELLKLYDRWVRTGNSRLHRLLAEKGLVPTAEHPGKYLN
jgi:hypothetical protein